MQRLTWFLRLALLGSGVLSSWTHAFGATCRPQIRGNPPCQGGTLSIRKRRCPPTVDEAFSMTPRSEDTENRARVRFTAKMTKGSSWIDQLLNLIISDVGSIAIGTLGLVLLLLGRLILDADTSAGAETTGDIRTEALEQATRINLLAVFATGSVLLNGISKLDIDAVVSPVVDLTGVLLSSVWRLIPQNSTNNDDRIRRTLLENPDLDWTLTSILKATTAETVTLLHYDSKCSQWNIIAMAGTSPVADPSQIAILSHATPVLDRFLPVSTEEDSDRIVQEETYLPTLQALPGRTEFTYLPVNTQAVLLIGVAPGCALVIGSNQAKSLSPRNIVWCQTVARRLGSALMI